MTEPAFLHAHYRRANPKKACYTMGGNATVQVSLFDDSGSETVAFIYESEKVEIYIPIVGTKIADATVFYVDRAEGPKDWVDFFLNNWLIAAPDIGEGKSMYLWWTSDMIVYFREHQHLAEFVALNK